MSDPGLRKRVDDLEEYTRQLAVTLRALIQRQVGDNPDEDMKFRLSTLAAIEENLRLRDR